MGKIIMIVLTTFFVFQFTIIAIDAQTTYINQQCVNSTRKFVNGSVYETNLNRLSDILVSISSSLKFHNSTYGDVPDKVYGLFQCRYDLDLDVCHRCIKDAGEKLLQVCHLYGEAIIYYDECMFRYANRSIFSMYEAAPMQSVYNSANMANYEEFLPILATTMKDIIKNASSKLPHYASGITNWTTLVTLYSFAQCTPDLTTFFCNSCLKFALSSMSLCCAGSTKVAIFEPSCVLWYDVSPFLNDHQSVVTTPPAIPPTPAKIITNDQDRKTSTKMKPTIIVAIAISAAAASLAMLAAVTWICMFRKKPKEVSDNGVPISSSRGVFDSKEKGDAESIRGTEFMEYDFATLSNATAGFSDDNKLGEGGFGVVYKGTLLNGQQIAIKRLSGASRQGTKEFMTEAGLLAKLQHKNLVRLLGFCSDGEEKLIVYEFMSNSSLDRFLFDTMKRPLLNWTIRYKIILGIARGLQYLHEDSRLTIIHRDLKPGNILLDTKMNPKIADFGIAKLFGGEQTHGNTSRIIGTQAYMAPEYLTTGEYSDKSDVYSFGIMLLEIVSGQKNRILNHTPRNEDLPMLAWRLWNEGRSSDMIDPTLYNSTSSNNVERCIQIGLLCLHANAEERPNMTSIVLMLTGSVDLPLPSTPTTMTSHKFNIRNSNAGDTQTDSVQPSTKSVTWQTDSSDRDLYPRPR